jgi:hypothetical protein
MPVPIPPPPSADNYTGQDPRDYYAQQLSQNSYGKHGAAHGQKYIQQQQYGAAQDLAQNGYSKNLGDYTQDNITQADETAPVFQALKQYGQDAIPTIDQTRTQTTGADAMQTALGYDQNVMNQGGLTDIDRAALAEAQNRVGVQARGNQQQIMSQAAQQGRAGGNASLLAALTNRQNQAQMNSANALGTSALALQRKDLAAQNMASTGNTLQTGVDAIDHFNTQGQRDNAAAIFATNSQNANQTTANTNMGILTNYGQNAQIHAGNTQAARSTEAYNKSASGGQRGQDAAKLQAANPLLGGAVTGVAQQMGQQATDQANAQANFTNNLINGGFGVLDAGLGAVGKSARGA